MRGIPKNVWSDDERVMVDMGQLRMPLPKNECIRLFKREPKNEQEARRFALQLKKSRRVVIFENVTTKNERTKSRRKERLERRKSKEREHVKVELNNVMMIDGREYPAMKECIEAAIENDSALVEREITDKDELNLKFNVLGKRSKVDRDGQKGALGKIMAIMESLGIDETTKVTFSDQ